MVYLLLFGKKIFSINMIFAYLNIFKPKAKMIHMRELFSSLQQKIWEIPGKKTFYSPLEVMKNQKNKLFKEHNDMIKKANLKYPIILTEKYQIVDGSHRLCKALLAKKKTIKAVVSSNKLLNKFLINKTGNMKVVNNMEINDYIELFYKRFM